MRGLPNQTLLFLTVSLLVACGRPGGTSSEDPSVSSVPEGREQGRVAEKNTRTSPPQDLVAAPGPRTPFKSPSLPPEDSNHSFVPYEIPTPIRDFMKTQEPPPAEPERSFELVNPYLRVDMEKERMTFTALMRIKGRPDESIRMGCPFDKTIVPIACNNMYPEEIRIAKQRRLQATAMCMDMSFDESRKKFVCSELVFDFFVVIDGKKEFQHFESKPVYVRPAQSGDDEGMEPVIPPVRKKKDQSRIQPTPVENKRPVESAPPSEGSAPPNQGPLPIESETPPSTDLQEEPPPPIAGSSQKQQSGADSIPPETESESTPEKDTKSSEQESQSPSPEETEKTDAGMTDLEMEDYLKNDQEGDALEFDGPTETPAPQTNSQFSIDGVGALKPAMGKSVRAQAYRKHTNGKLFTPMQMAKAPAKGFMVRPRTASSTSFSTDLMAELVAGATQAMDKKFPNRPPVVVGDISKSTGGKLKSHRSHQTGLDADISFPSRRQHKELWDATGSPSDLDVERFLFLTEKMSCAKGSPVIAYFVDRAIKKRVCALAKQQGRDLRDTNSCTYKALRHMIHWPGHKNHFHMRLRCPGNPGCTPVNVVPKFSGTGCS